MSLAANTIEETLVFWPRTEWKKAVFFYGSRIESLCGYRVGLSEIGAEGQKVQKSKLVHYFLL